MIERDVTELQQDLQTILDRVKQGEDVIVKENDEAIAVLVHPAKVGSRTRSSNTETADALFERLGEMGPAKPGGGAGFRHERAEEMIEELRSDWEDRH